MANKQRPGKTKLVDATVLAYISHHSTFVYESLSKSVGTTRGPRGGFKKKNRSIDR